MWFLFHEKSLLPNWPACGELSEMKFLTLRSLPKTSRIARANRPPCEYPNKWIPSGWRSEISFKSWPNSSTWCQAFSKLDHPENRSVLYTIVPGCAWNTQIYSNLANKITNFLLYFLRLKVFSLTFCYLYLFDFLLNQGHTRSSGHYSMNQNYLKVEKNNIEWELLTPNMNHILIKISLLFNSLVCMLELHCTDLRWVWKISE